jgi:phosphoribosylglycinamide formyltransferase-1
MYLKIGFLVSGIGTTMEAISTACKKGKINGVVCVVISNKRDAPALDLATKLGIPNFYVEAENRYEKIARIFKEHNVNLVVSAGFLDLVKEPVLEQFTAINTHPSLLPKFGGKGMFGDAVYEAVLASGDTETGATVHFLNDAYDEGAIIDQMTIDINPNDTVKTLKERVKEEEKELLIQVLKDPSKLLPLKGCDNSS